MQSLNALADVEGEDPEDIARDFLIAQGLIKG
jgi:osmoprotectant transport system substrate-binding protein